MEDVYSISFKRKQKQRSGFSLSNLFSNNTTESVAGDAAFTSSNTRNGQLHGSASSAWDRLMSSNGNVTAQKDGGLLDWYVEGPGRRVGYDDLTAIDWIFEYTKERQRKRHLYSHGQGAVGYVFKFLDASNVWIVLIATGILVGIIAAFIDVASDWLGDLKTGYCKNGAGGGKFYLNKSFCCWGHDDISNCLDWTPWGKALGVTSSGGVFTVEYLFYVLYSTMWQSFVCAMVAAVTLQALNPFRTGNIVLYEVTYTRGWHRFEMIPFVTLGILGGLYGAFLIRLNMKIAQWRRSRSWSRPIAEVVLVALLSALINYPNLFMRSQNTELVHSLFAECGNGGEDTFGLCKTGAASVTTIALLLMAAILGFFLASMTFGLDLPAGIILPSVAIGALYGRALGTTFKMWQEAYPSVFLFRNCEPDIPCVTPGLYAIVGAASALGGATRMTVSIVVIMFELTGALTYVIPIMIAVMLSKWCGDIFGKRGIYESWIELNEYPFLDQRDDTTPPDVPTHKVMTSVDDLTVITAVGHTIDSLRHLLLTTSYRGYPVVTDTSTPTLLGYISRNELSFALKYSKSPTDRELSGETQVFFTHQPFADPVETLDLRPWMDQTPITLNSSTTFSLVLQMFQRLGLRYILLSDKGVLQGLLTKKDVWSVINGPEFRKGGFSRESVVRPANTAEEVGLLENDDVTSLASSLERRQSL
ncbi:hypothetical protein APSETT445_003536 [Aspergillus pseudonomiae]